MMAESATSKKHRRWAGSKYWWNREAMHGCVATAAGAKQQSVRRGWRGERQTQRQTESGGVGYGIGTAVLVGVAKHVPTGRDDPGPHDCSFSTVRDRIPYL